ncbi:MAG: Ldh family oxidoreductase [Candidatus Velthaea sp.]
MASSIEDDGLSESSVCRPPLYLETFACRVLEKMGAGEDVAREVARHLVRSNMSGHDSHGVLRLAQYASQAAESSELVPAARPEVISENGVCAVIDAHRGFGHFATRFALEWAMNKANALGVGAVAMRHSTHIGRLGEYGELAAEAGMIAIVTMGIAGPNAHGVVPFGGKRGFLATNPWSIGVPSAEGTAFTFDAATSSIAEGKMRQARASGTPLPPGSIVDRDGHPTNDANAYFNGGALLPLGGEAFGHKGYGLGLASALIAGLAMIDDTNPNFASPTFRGRADWDGILSGVFLIAINPANFGDAKHYERRVAGTLAAAHRDPPAPGYTEVLTAGEPEARNREKTAREGIILPRPIWNELAALARKFDVDFE